jgi:hypothetical protein
MPLSLASSTQIPLRETNNMRDGETAAARERGEELRWQRTEERKVISADRSDSKV